MRVILFGGMHACAFVLFHLGFHRTSLQFVSSERSSTVSQTEAEQKTDYDDDDGK